MAQQFTPTNQAMADVTSDDKLWALLSYLIPVLVPILVLIMEDKKNRPFIKVHAVQALIFAVVYIVLNMILGVTVILAVLSCILIPICYALSIYWGLKAYRGEMVTIPVITNWVKSQGWA